MDDNTALVLLGFAFAILVIGVAFAAAWRDRKPRVRDDTPEWVLSHSEWQTKATPTPKAPKGSDVDERN